jgi:hypothetical protein
MSDDNQEREVIAVDEANVRDTLTVRGQERFADHAELDSTPIQAIAADPTQSELRDVISDLQRRVAGIQGVDLLIAPSPPPPRD